MSATNAVRALHTMGISPTHVRFSDSHRRRNAPWNGNLQVGGTMRTVPTALSSATNPSFFSLPARTSRDVHVRPRIRGAPGFNTPFRDPSRPFISKHAPGAPNISPMRFRKPNFPRSGW